MDTDTLRNLQAPLKKLYRESPESALYTLRASARLGEGISCSVDTGRTKVIAGLHKATGGSGELACSGDLLLEALVACAGVTCSAVATALGIIIQEGRIRAEGDIDFRGTLGVSRDVPVGFIQIRLCFELKSEATEEQYESLMKLTERYCVVYQTLFNGVNIHTSLHRI